MDDWLDACELGDTAPPKDDARSRDDRSLPAHVADAIAQYDAAFYAALYCALQKPRRFNLSLKRRKVA